MLFNPDLRTAVIMIPGLCGVILVFVGTIATALGVVRERQAGTMEQLAVMPFRPRDVFLGKIAPYLLVAAVDMVVIVAAGMLLFNVPFRGSVLTFALGSVLFLFVTLGIGVLISSVSQTQGQAIQLAILTLLPQILLSGLFFPLYAMPWGVRWIGYCLPLTYFIQIARGVMVRGAPIGALWLPMLVLAGMAIVVFTLSTLRFRRDLAPAGDRPGRSMSGAGPGDAGVTTAAARPGRAAPVAQERARTAGECADLTVRCGKRTALRDVDLAAAAGAVTAVIGGDGAGKSTLLRTLAGGLAAALGRGAPAGAPPDRLRRRRQRHLRRPQRRRERRVRRGGLRRPRRRPRAPRPAT